MEEEWKRMSWLELPVDAGEDGNLVLLTVVPQAPIEKNILG
jgi:hypothetical protein